MLNECSVNLKPYILELYLTKIYTAYDILFQNEYAHINFHKIGNECDLRYYMQYTDMLVIGEYLIILSLRNSKWY